MNKVIIVGRSEACQVQGDLVGVHRKPAGNNQTESLGHAEQGDTGMKLTPEEIKQWNDAVSQLTAICNKHCTEEHQCEDCPFDSLRFGEYGEPEFCGIRAGVLYRGEHMVTPDDYLKNIKEKRLRSCELLSVVKNCITCHWRNKESNFCPKLGIHIMLPDTKLCDQWEPRVDLFEMEQKP